MTEVCKEKVAQINIIKMQNVLQRLMFKEFSLFPDLTEANTKQPLVTM